MKEDNVYKVEIVTDTWNGWREEGMDEWREREGWKDTWMDGWMDGWRDKEGRDEGREG